MVAEPNDKCDKGLNECTLTIHGELNDSPAVPLRKRGLWSEKQTFDLTVRCPEPIGMLGMVTIDDGIGGMIAARVVAKVIVMRRKSYDPPWNFTNPYSSQAEAEGKSPRTFDRKTGCLQMSLDPPTMKEVQAEPEPEPEPVVKAPEPEPELEPEEKRNVREEMKRQAEEERAAADAAAEAMAAERAAQA
jgi:hypothetical protein